MPTESEIITFFDVPNQHFADRSARWALRDYENVRALVYLVLPEAAAQMDFSNMARMTSSFLMDNLRRQESDIVVEVPYRNQSATDDLIIYILIEHQSTVDSTMPVRLLLYMTQIWDSQRREWESKGVPRSERRFRPILPIVFYTGNRPWNASLSLHEIMGTPAELVRFVPKFEILYLGVMQTRDAELTKTAHPLGWLLTVLKKADAPKQTLRRAIIEAMSSMNALDDELARQRRQAIEYFLLLIFHRRPTDEHDELRALVNENIEHPTEKEEAKSVAQTMAQHLREEGAAQTAQRIFLKLLRSRFNSVPETVIQRITLIRDLSRLDALIDMALNAETLEEIDSEIDDRE